MTMTRRTVGGVAMLALLPGEAASQCVTNPLDQLLLPGETVARTSTEGVATSLDELLHVHGLQIGDGVYLTDVTGCRIKADISDVSPDSVTLATRRGTRLFREGEILKIERQDSVWNGIGIGIGLAALSARGFLGSGSDSWSAVLSVYGLVFGGSALIGWAVDANIHETVYEAPGAGWTFKPLLTKGGAGASMSVGW